MSGFDARTASPAEYAAARAEIVRPRRYSPPVAPAPEPATPAVAKADPDTLDDAPEDQPRSPSRGPTPAPADPSDARKIAAKDYPAAKAAMLAAARGRR